MSSGVIDTGLGNALSAAQGFVKTVRSSLFNIMNAVEVGRFDRSFTQSGMQFSLGKSTTAGASVSFNPDPSDAFAGMFARDYNIASMMPNASVIVKKRMFTTLAYENDVRFIDSFERSFLRASKNLFQLKAFQIATYEALTKFEQVLQQDKVMYIPAVMTAVQSANAFGALSDEEASGMQSTLLQIAQRDLAGDDPNYTTWFVDHLDKDLSNIGRGVGVIEFTNFTKIETSNAIDGDGTASVEFEDPYHIMLISNDDIESAVRGALFDSLTTTLLPALAIDQMQSLSESLQNQINSGNPILEAEATAAINSVQETSRDVLNQQPDSPAMVSFVRKKLRKFYLGKSIIQPTDGLHVFLKSDTIFENDSDPTGLPMGLDRFGVDEEILRQEMYVVTGDRHFDINFYKMLRDKNAFSGASVFAGVVEKVTDNFSDGFYTLSISAKNNLWYLEQSFVNTEPALDQSQGFLHDPLTPFDFEFDNFGNIKTTDSTDGSSGFKLSQDNIDRLSQVQIKHEVGHLRGTQVDTTNIVNSTVPGTTIQQTDHFPGMLYKWKEGIASVSIPNGIGTADPTGLFYNQSREAANAAYGLAITSTPFDNMDAANVISLLVTGMPYNISNFINDSVITGAINSLGKTSSDGTSYFSTLFDVIQRQNKVLGNFKPLLNGDSVNIDDVKKLAYKKISYRQLDVRIGQLEDQIFDAQQKLDRLPSTIDAAETDLLEKTRIGLKDEIAALQSEENLLIQQFAALDKDMQRITSNQDSMGFSNDPEQREAQLTDFQFRQLYAASRRIEDVRYNRDVNYFIVGTEYDSDSDIQAFAANMRGAFNYFNNVYDPAITKAREASKAIDFEFFCDNSGNIRFRPPQYNKVPLSIYYELFRRKGQQGVDLIPDFVKSLFIDTIANAREGIVKTNWQMLIELGKSGSDALINVLNANVPSASGSSKQVGVVEFLGYSGKEPVSDGNITDELIEFNSADRVHIDRASPPSSKAASGNALTLVVLNNLCTQLEKRFGIKQATLTSDDVVSTNDDMAITKRKTLFQNLRSISSHRNSLVKAYLSQLNKLGLDANNVGNTQQSTTAAVDNAVAAQKDKLAQEVFQIVSTGGFQGATRPVISSEFQNLVEDDSRNFIGRGSGRRFVIRDDSIKSFSIEESSPDFCRVNVTGQLNFGGQAFGPNFLENRTLWAGAVDYDLWRMYGFKNRDDVKVPFLSDPETQLKPYAVFLLLRQRRKVMHGSIVVVGNEYYQLGDVVYLADRDMLFYVTGVSHSFGEGEDFTTRLTLAYGRPPGEYIPTPLDVIGKTILKQSISTINVTKRHMNPDTFYYPLRPTPAIYLPQVTTSDDKGLKQMLSTDGNQGRLINALLNANIALQKPNALLIISGFTTGSKEDQYAQKRVGAVVSWFKAPKVLSKNLSDSTLTDFTDYSAIDPNKIKTKILNITNKNEQTSATASNESENTVVTTNDQTIINPIGDSNIEYGILNACQEVYAKIGDFKDTKEQIPVIVEIGIFYQKSK